MATSTTFNTTQRHLLQMFSRMSSNSLKEMKKVLLNFYASKMQKGIDEYWEENNMGEEDIDAILNEHMRTPYSQGK